AIASGVVWSPWVPRSSHAKSTKVRSCSILSLAIALAPGTPHCVPAGSYQVAVLELNEDRVHPPTADQNSAPLSLALWEPGAPPPHVVIRARHRSRSCRWGGPRGRGADPRSRHGARAENRPMVDTLSPRLAKLR